MKKRILVIILILVFLTGCNMNYKIVINKDLSSSESINFFVSDNMIDDIKEKYGEDFIKESILHFKDSSEKDGYTFSYKYKDNLKINSIKENSSININNSIMNQSYNFHDFSCNSNYCFLYAVANNNIQADDGMVYNLKLSVQVPYKVLLNNADKVDKLNNIYTWYVDTDKDNSAIELLFEKSGVNVITRNKIFYFIKLGIFAIIGLTVIFALIKLMIKLNKNNKPIF